MATLPDHGSTVARIFPLVGIKDEFRVFIFSLNSQITSLILLHKD